MKYHLIWLISLFFLSFSSFALECPPDKHKVRAHFRNGSNVKEYCRKGPKTKVRFKFRINTGKLKNWYYSKEKQKEWKAHEKKLVDSIIKDLPPYLKKLKGIQVYRYEKSVEIDNTGAYYERQIILYDAAFKSKDELLGTIIHEYAHALYENLPDKTKKSYQEELGWEKVIGQLWHGRDIGYVDLDGVTSPDEDFSNNLEVYLTNSKQLKKITPKAYNWFKRNLK